MVVTLTDAALNKLQTLDVREGQILRIDADIAGGCGMSVSYKVIVDESRRNDHMIDYQGFQIGLDRFTMRSLEGEAHIDYTEENGFIFGEVFTSATCAIEMNNHTVGRQG